MSADNSLQALVRAGIRFSLIRSRHVGMVINDPLMDLHDMMICELIQTMSESDIEVNQSSIIKVLGCNPQKANYIIAPLIKKGWLTMAQSNEDRRSKILTLTESGKKVYNDTLSWHASCLEGMFDQRVPEDHELTPQSLNVAAKATMEDWFNVRILKILQAARKSPST